MEANEEIIIMLILDCSVNTNMHVHEGSNEKHLKAAATEHAPVLLV